MNWEKIASFFIGLIASSTVLIYRIIVTGIIYLNPVNFFNQVINWLLFLSTVGAIFYYWKKNRAISCGIISSYAVIIISAIVFTYLVIIAWSAG